MDTGGAQEESKVCVPLFMAALLLFMAKALLFMAKTLLFMAKTLPFMATAGLCMAVMRCQQRRLCGQEWRRCEMLTRMAAAGPRHVSVQVRHCREHEAAARAQVPRALPPYSHVTRDVT